MRFNQFSYYPVSQQEALQELSSLGFKLDQSNSDKELFEAFVRTCFFNYKNTDYPLQLWQWIRKQTYTLSLTLS